MPYFGIANEADIKASEERLKLEIEKLQNATKRADRIAIISLALGIMGLLAAIIQFFK